LKKPITNKKCPHTVGAFFAFFNTVWGVIGKRNALRQQKGAESRAFFAMFAGE
jgi:hypothetical protein